MATTGADTQSQTQVLEFPSLLISPKKLSTTQEKRLSSPPHIGDPFKREANPLSPIGGGRARFRPTSGDSAASRSTSKTAVQPFSSVESRDAATQSDYRESDTQTDPYSPEFAPLTAGVEPEVLYLAKLGLKFDHGYPIGQEDIDFIERTRQKRSFEAALPPIIDETSLEYRRQKLEEQEKRELAFRDQQMRNVHQQKLETLEKTLRAQEDEREYLNAQKVERIMQRAAEQRDVAWLKIQKRRLTLLRKLAKDRENIEGKKTRGDIIEDYANYASKVYAPLQRDGNKKDQALILQDIKPPILENLRELSALERTVKETQTEKPMLTADPRRRTKVQRQENALNVELEKIDDSMRASKKLKEDRERRPVFAEKIAKPPPRPPTPSVEQPLDDEAETQAVLFLQRLLRGRAIQNMMYEGKLRRIELIEELKVEPAEVPAAAAPPAPIAAAEPAAPAASSSSSSLPDRAQVQAEAVRNLFDEFMAGIVGQGLDFLSKELVRVNEHRRIAAIVHEAERVRRMREAAESGRRQLEEEQRAREDAQYAQVMAVHHRTADTYYEWILDEAERIIDAEIAKREAEERRQEELRKASEPVPPEDVINDLVFAYLFPLVESELQKSSDAVAARAPGAAVLAELHSIIPDITRAMTFVK